MDAMDTSSTGESPADRPDIELCHLVDDPANPAELTIFSPEARSLATEWVTASRSAAVRLDEMR
ncbi:MAG: hypothetical protein ABEH78_03955 [Haloferacaceae archaeon]